MVGAGQPGHFTAAQVSPNILLADILESTTSDMPYKQNFEPIMNKSTALGNSTGSTTAKATTIHTLY